MLFRQLILIIAICALTGCNPSGQTEDIYTNLSPQEIYQRGKKAVKQKNWEIAIKEFEALEGKYPYGEWTDKGQMASIYAHYEAGDSAAALAAAERFIRIHPRHPEVDFAYYMKGVINYADNFSPVFRYLPLDRSKRDSELAQQSFDAFKTLLEKFPSSRYAADARKRMIKMRNQMASHELHIAEYYIKQQAYLAAANRAGFVIQQFPQASVTTKALRLMIHAYEKMGMTTEAAKAKAILAENS